MLLSRLKESKYSTLILASIFAFTLFLQCCYFHYQAFHSILISSLWNNPISFFTFYAPKISISLFIASFVFLLKRKSWIIYVSFLVSIWCIAELVYFRANGIFLDAYSFTMISNMEGFWGAISMYIYDTDFFIFLPSFLLFLSYYISDKNKRNVQTYFIFLLISIIIHIFSFYSVYYTLFKRPGGLHDYKLVYINPFSDIGVRRFWGFTSIEYLQITSPLHKLIYEIKSFLLLPFNVDTYILNDNEIAIVNQFLESNKCNYSDEHNKLIVILVESFETWALVDEVMPNLLKFTDSNNIIYYKRIISQPKFAMSADGQMIVNTGLLPINEGATCFRFPVNTYPALGKLYNSSLGLIPGNPSVWNQKRMSEAYGIKNNIYDSSSNDSILFSRLSYFLYNYDYILAITMASHNPFDSYADKSDLKLVDGMPLTMSNYLKSISYTDKYLKQFLSRIQSDSILQNSTIVITGDHTIFPSEIRKEFSDYCKANNLDYKVEENYCPLIIYSPNIKEKTIVDEVAYQMDIYPTILHVIGAEDYYWKGFGVNLLDSVARQNRPISPEDAFELSDKLIRANYFKEIEDSLYSQNY